MGGLPVRKFPRSTLQNVSCFVKLFCDCMRARVSFERPVWLGVMPHTAVFLVGSICSHGSLPHKICCCTRKAKPRLKPQRKAALLLLAKQTLTQTRARSRCIKVLADDDSDGIFCAALLAHDGSCRMLDGKDALSCHQAATLDLPAGFLRESRLKGCPSGSCARFYQTFSAHVHDLRLPT